MTTLLNTGVLGLLINRLSTLKPDSPRRWGKMSVGGMLCHLNDSYAGVLRGDSLQETKPTLAGRYVLRPTALRVPLRWPQGVPTLPAVDQLIGDTQPSTFEADRTAVVASLSGFAQTVDLGGRTHPIFGPMSEWEWMR